MSAGILRSQQEFQAQLFFSWFLQIVDGSLAFMFGVVLVAISSLSNIYIYIYIHIHIYIYIYLYLY